LSHPLLPLSARRNLTPPPETVALLLSHFTTPPTAEEQKQAFLDAPNEYGNTGLHWAALGGHLAVVKLLVEAGASVALANDKNYVPLDLASFGEKFDVVDYFLEKSGGLEDENAEDGGGLEGAVEGVTLTEKDLEEEVGGDVEGKRKETETKGS
jgi:ankyrin repeat protein